MKTPFYSFAAVLLAISFAACQNQGRYLDLNTNQHVEVKKDSVTGRMINAKTGEPVDVYVDTKTHDTIYGLTGETVNGRVVKGSDGVWIVKNDGDEYKAKSESENSAKVKREGGEYKYKNEDYKVKREDDGDVKIKTGDKTIKIDGKTGERKVKKD